MELNEAKAEASRRWPAIGGWAELRFRRTREIEGKFVDENWCVVGFRRDAPGGGVEKVVLGKSTSFEEAFVKADIRVSKAEHELKNPPPAKPVVIDPRAYPTVEMEF